MSTNTKNLTFFLYANGHNELEPETWQSVMEIQNSHIEKQINVVVQVSREAPSVVKLLRPDLSLENCDQWSGVRRYVFSDERYNQFYELDNINMADPHALFDFMIWGITNFPAKRYILSISGHIYQFVGLCPDYSGDAPYIMGFPEISFCIQSVCEKCNVELELLILDTCYASTVEILYEMGRYEHPLIKNILTYIGNGPLVGLPYGNVLSVLNRVSAASMDDVLQSLVSGIHINPYLYGLIALKIDHEVLELVKQLFSKLAATYLRCKKTYAVEFTPEELLSNYRADYPWSLYLKPIHRLLKSLIVVKKAAKNDKNKVLPIHILYLKIPDELRKKLYARLSFSKQNLWAVLLCDLPPEQLSNIPSDGMIPIEMAKNILTAFICSSNENFSMQKLKRITEDLIEKKDWKLT